MNEFFLKVLPEDSGKRLDLFLFGFFAKEKSGFSRTFIQDLITSGKVTCGGVESPKPHHKVKSDEVYRVAVEEKKERRLEAEDIPLEVVYEDDDLAVINKPAGLVVHPAPGNYAHTLVHALLNRFKDLSDVDPERPGIVHRLDKETSGLIVIAKNNFSHHALAKQFAEHSIKRTYIALVRGRVDFDENIIEAPIGRHPVKRKNMAVTFTEEARSAKTHYRTLRRSDAYSLLELSPFTGRTHQLRVHLAFIGHPILGDEKYGRKKEFGRLALHARSIGFLHPKTSKFMEFSSEIPEEFSEFIHKIT